MSKLLFWVVTILVILIAMRLLARASAAKQRRTHQAEHKRAVPRRYTDMVQCAHCHVHVPKSEALFQLGDYWCSNEHARLGRNR